MGDDLASRRIFSLAAGGGTVFAGSYDGVWRGRRHDSGWERVDTGLSPDDAFCVAVGPDGQVVAGTQSGAMGSTDAGSTWEPVDTFSRDQVHAICWTSTGELLAGTTDGIRTASGRRELAGRWVFTLLPLDEGRVVAGTMGDGVFAGSAAGQWETSSAGLAHPLVLHLHRTRNGAVLAATGARTAGAKTGGVFRSTDGGRSWAPADHEPVTVYRIVEDSSGRLFAGAQRCRILRSTDGGASWDAIQADVDDLKMFCLAVDSADRLYLAAGSMLLRSDDGAGTWMEVGDGLDGVTVYDIAEHPTGTLMAATSAGIYRSTDAGWTWDPSHVT